MSIEWREIQGGYYAVSNRGQVRRLRSVSPGTERFVGKLIKQRPGSRGHMRVQIYAPGVRRSFFVHRLVAEAFIGPRPDGLFVNHKNGKKQDNRPENLEYVTHRQNTDHAVKNGLIECGEKNSMSKLTLEQVRLIRSSKESGASLARKLGVHWTTVSQVRLGITWSRALGNAASRIGKP